MHYPSEDEFSETSDLESSSSATGAFEPEDSTFSTSVAEGKTLLDYARSHTLCTDYTLVDPLAPGVLGDLDPGPDTTQSDLCEVQLSSPFKVEEKLALDKASLVFLHDTLSLMDCDFPETIVTYERMPTLRSESPLLPTDAELEYRLFTKKVDYGKGLDTSDFPRFAAASDKGLERFPPDLLDAKNAQISSEKLQLTTRDISFLKEVCWDVANDYGDETVLQEFKGLKVSFSSSNATNSTLIDSARPRNLSTKDFHYCRCRLPSYTVFPNQLWASYHLRRVQSIHSRTNWLGSISSF